MNKEEILSIINKLIDYYELGHDYRRHNPEKNTEKLTENFMLMKESFYREYHAKMSIFDNQIYCYLDEFKSWLLQQESLEALCNISSASTNKMES